MYCSPVNCYCAEVLGDLNQLNLKIKLITSGRKIFFVSKKSAYEASVVKSQFFGKEYKIRAIVNDFTWCFSNDKPLKIGSKIYLDFNQKDVLEFDSSCSTFLQISSKS